MFVMRSVWTLSPTSSAKEVKWGKGAAHRRDILHRVKGTRLWTTPTRALGQVQDRKIQDSEDSQDSVGSYTKPAPDPPPSKSGNFDWTKQWWPVAIEADLAPDRPHAIRLLGNPIVVWMDGQGAWCAFKDVCPHRLVALSEGRVENGNLMCSYHGWEFQGCGKLANVPQADNTKTLENAMKSRRSSCQVHPCQVADGLIWVYGEATDESEARKQSIESMLLPQSAPDTFKTPYFQRDLPYGCDTLFENLLDPSHVPFTHSGVANQGNRFNIHKTCIARGEGITEKGFSVVVKEPEDMPLEKKILGEFPYTLSFTAPAHVRYDHGERRQLGFYAVPTDPGKCRIIFKVAAPFMKLKGPLAIFIKLLHSKWGLWYDHFSRNDVLDGDNCFLALQDRDMRRRRADGHNAARFFFMPTSLDLGVSELHRWLTKYGGSFPWGPGALDPEPMATGPRSELLNRMESHTKNCHSCTLAHKTFKYLQWIAAVVSVSMVILAAFSLGSGVTFKKLLLPIAAVISAKAGLLAHSFKQRLEFVDYRHPDH